MARLRAAQIAERPQRCARQERDRPLHLGVRPDDATDRRLLLGRARAVSRLCSQRRSRRSRGHGGTERRRSDRAGNGRSRCPRERRAEAPGRGADRRDGHAPPDPPARLADGFRRGRGRPCPRSRRPARLPGERGVRGLRDRSTPSAHGDRPARGRTHAHGRRRRTAVGVLGRDDHVRDGADDDAARRSARDAARRRGVVHPGIRRRRSQSAVRRARATHLDRRHAPVLRRLRAAPARSRRVAERRRRRRDAGALVQGRSPVDDHGDAHRSGRHDCLAGGRHRARARRVRRRVPATDADAGGPAVVAASTGRGSLDADGQRARRPGPRIDRDPSVRGQLDARVASRRPRARRRSSLGRAGRHPLDAITRGPREGHDRDAGRGRRTHRVERRARRRRPGRRVGRTRSEPQARRHGPLRRPRHGDERAGRRVAGAVRHGAPGRAGRPTDGATTVTPCSSSRRS